MSKAGDIGDVRAPLLFVDTNILLDFYRALEGNGTEALLSLHDVPMLIMTEQVEAEFKAKREEQLQRAILAARKMKVAPIGVCGFRSKAGSPAELQGVMNQVNDRVELLIKDLNAALKDPNLDPVARVVENLSSSRVDRHRSPGPELDELVAGVHRRAVERNARGYPPRDRRGRSCGDAVNWEWIVLAATEQGRDVLIVSRDKAYGIRAGSGEWIVNQWLREEFSRRVGRGLKVELTARLTDALRRVHVGVSEESRRWEEDVEAQIAAVTTHDDSLHSLFKHRSSLAMTRAQREGLAMSREGWDEAWGTDWSESYRHRPF